MKSTAHRQRIASSQALAAEARTETGGMAPTAPTSPPTTPISKPRRGRRRAVLTNRLIDTICLRIACGESLRQILADPSLPSYATVMRWLATSDRGEQPELLHEFREHYARARTLQADTLVDEALDAARSATPENCQVTRLLVDTIKWRAAHLNPRAYGPKVDLTHQTPQESDLDKLLREIKEKSGPWTPPMDSRPADWTGHLE